MRVLGMISGTSHDGIDVAVVDFAVRDTAARGDGEAEVVATIEYSATTPYPDELRERLIASLPPAAVGFDIVCELDTAIGQEFARAAAQAVDAHREAGFDAVDLVCSHGQTVFHWVDGGEVKGTLQLGQSAWISEATGLPVVSDVRAADIAAGGQGAPLVPILDLILLRPFAEAGRSAAALNLGGISNATIVSPDAPVSAWDLGPANALIDAAVTASREVPGTFDRDGALAAAGAVDERLLANLLAEPYYALPAPKSTGKELFHLDYLRRHLAALPAEPALPDLVATLTELTARTVADALANARVKTVVASGGGVRNPVMMRRIAELLPGVEVSTADSLGVSSDAKEAVAFALIGWASAHGLPGNVPSCTGASGERVLGRISPAPSGSLPATAPFAHRPRIVFAGPDRPERMGDGG